jgi:hypothetical protein
MLTLFIGSCAAAGLMTFLFGYYWGLKNGMEIDTEFTVIKNEKSVDIHDQVLIPMPIPERQSRPDGFAVPAEIQYKD